ncbi:MAG TPA: serine hydrolase domain-containing protein [Trueperaceae bacterium]
MKPARILLLISSALFLAFAAAQQPDTETVPGQVAGEWHGNIELPGMPLEVIVTLEQAGEEWRGSIDIPAQGAEDLALDEINVQGDVVSFRISGVPGEPTFQATLAEGELTGIFIQSGQEFPFVLERARTSAPLAGPAEASEYTDPRGRFTFPVPTGWTTARRDGFVEVASPEEGIRIYVYVTDTDDLEAAIREAWSVADPSFDLEPQEILQPPSEPGVEETVLANYDAGDDEQIYQAIAQLRDGTAYVMLFDAELAAVQRRGAQLQIVASGFEITGVEQVDLGGAQPLEVDAIADELEVFIEETMAAFGIPGAAVAVVQGGEVVYSNGFGTREAGGSEPVTPDTHMMIGSVGKTMTSMAIATMVDDGIVDWDTPVVEVLPEFEVADAQLTQEITIRNLLCACTGVPRRDLELFFNAEELSAEDIVESLATFEFFTAFGEAFQYSNQLVATAGYAAAAAAGAEFGDLLEGYIRVLDERVLTPIAMDRTTLSFEEVTSRSEFALPHQQNLETGVYEPVSLAFEKLLLPVAPAGAHWSTAEDMARYLITQLDTGVAPDGDRVVSRENLLETWEPQVPLSATESYGLGWFVGEYKGLEHIYHGGNTLGFTSQLSFIPAADTGIVVLTNAQATNAFNTAVSTRLYELVYEQPSEVDAQVEFLVTQSETALAEAREQVQDAVEPDEVSPFLGRYENEALGEISLEMVGTQLFLDAGSFRSEIRPAFDREGEFDTYITYGAPIVGLPIALETGEAGEQTVVLGSGAIEYTFERVLGTGDSTSP